MQAVEFTPQDQREAQRLRAWQLKQNGWKQKDIADSLGVSQTAVSNWIRRVRQSGTQSLRTRHSPGAPPRRCSLPPPLPALPLALARLEVEQGSA